MNRVFGTNGAPIPPRPTAEQIQGMIAAKFSPFIAIMERQLSLFSVIVAEMKAGVIDAERNTLRIIEIEALTKSLVNFRPKESDDETNDAT